MDNFTTTTAPAEKPNTEIVNRFGGYFQNISNLNELQAIERIFERKKAAIKKSSNAVKESREKSIRPQFLEDLKQLAIKHGIKNLKNFLATQIIPSFSARNKTGVKVAPKYKNPYDETQTWTGRGVKPRWMVDGIASGKFTFEQCEIK